ncbi:hypothetical protein LR48_Vigan03g097400 [Vigna angularis]|uniref:Uncharacterized protein n=1 Tax=Phaseolus angularis TaxID=3914 RepID=A0A0L9U4J9_PHAAN|nr:hypothetical protein LR48_Vigan03g097400 [Vigna angularis]
MKMRDVEDKEEEEEDEFSVKKMKKRGKSCVDSVPAEVPPIEEGVFGSGGLGIGSGGLGIDSGAMKTYNWMVFSSRDEGFGSSMFWFHHIRFQHVFLSRSVSHLPLQTTSAFLKPKRDSNSNQNRTFNSSSQL